MSPSPVVAFAALGGLSREPLALVDPAGNVVAANATLALRVQESVVGRPAAELELEGVTRIPLGDHVVLRWPATDDDVARLAAELVRSREEAANQQRAAAEELHASEERFHRLVDAVTDYAIFMLDETGHVATWNAGARKTKGYEASEIVGKHFSVFYTPEDRAAGRPQRVLDTVRREGHVEDEGWRVRKDGTRFWANVVVTALRGPDGRLIGFAKVTRDLTQRRLAEENERALLREQASRAVAERERGRLLTLLEQVPARINFLRGPDLVFEFAHPKTLESMRGRAVLGVPLLDALPEQDGRVYYDLLRGVYDTGEPVAQTETPIWFEGESGREITYWDAVYLPVRDAAGVIDGVMTFEIDVTKRVLAREELERASRAKDEFLATMSHELRTPLNAITGWAILLQRTRDEIKLAHGLEVIERNAKAQARIVNDLLDVSRIISGKLQLTLKRTEIGPVVRAAADVVRAAAEAKGIRLVLDIDPGVGAMVADPDRLQQVVWNLLTNAVRFTPRGGRVMVSVDQGESGLILRVADNGAGIAAPHMPHIFERFRQIDSSTTRAHGGLGLGLAIVRHLVEAHGGHVEASSDGLGKGTTFTINLPIRAVDVTQPSAAESGPSLESAPAATPGVASLAGVRVLAVDDDKDSLELVVSVLEAAGARVVGAASAPLALRLVETAGPFDVIVSDIGMPGMDGYTFVQKLRALGAPAVPAIALTAYARVEDGERAKRAGFEAHLAKPVDERVLIETIRSFSGVS